MSVRVTLAAQRRTSSELARVRRHEHALLRDSALPEVPGMATCPRCGDTVEQADMLFSDHGPRCVTCFGEQEADQATVSVWREMAPTAVLASLGWFPLAIAAVSTAGWVQLGPPEALAWLVLIIVPVMACLVTVVSASRHLRDMWRNPLDEELDRWSFLARMGVSGVGVLGSLSALILLVVAAVRPFV